MFPQDMSEKLHTYILSTFLCLKPTCRGSCDLQSESRCPRSRGNSVIREEQEERFLWTSILDTDSLGTFPISTATFLSNDKQCPLCWNQAFYEMSTFLNPRMSLSSPLPRSCHRRPGTTCRNDIASRRSSPSLHFLSREGNFCPLTSPLWAQVKMTSFHQLISHRLFHQGSETNEDSPCCRLSKRGKSLVLFILLLCHQTHTCLLSLIINVPRPAAPAHLQVFGGYPVNT